MSHVFFALFLLILAPPLARADWPVPQFEVATGAIIEIDGHAEGYAPLVAAVNPRGLPGYADNDVVLAAMAKEILQCGVSIRGPLCEGGRFRSAEGSWLAMVVAGSREYRVKGFRDTAGDGARMFAVVYPATAADPASKYGYIYEVPSAAARLAGAYGLFTENGIKAKPVLSFSRTGELPSASAAVAAATNGSHQVTISTQTVQLTAAYAAQLPHATGGFGPYQHGQFESEDVNWVAHCQGMLLRFEAKDQLLVSYLNNGASFPFQCDPPHMRCSRITHPTGSPGAFETPVTLEFLADGSIVDVEDSLVRVYRRVTDCPAR